MALSIKDPETDRLVRRLARQRRTSFTQAIKLAVKNELGKKGHVEESDFMRAVKKAQALIGEMPVLTDMSDDEILGYDEHGLPA